MNKLQRPILPVEFVQDFFANCGVECLSMRLSRNPTAAEKAALDALYEAITWANDLGQEATENNGQVSELTNTTAVDCLLAGWDAMRTLRFLQ